MLSSNLVRIVNDLLLAVLDTPEDMVVVHMEQILIAVALSVAATSSEARTQALKGAALISRLVHAAVAGLD